jgi:HEPN domain-containing protein
MVLEPFLKCYQSQLQKPRKTKLKVLKDYLLELDILEDAYITSRCITREFAREELEKLAEAVKKIMKNVT